jgi:23S rRNA (uridine2552-2'-O)-methyltransferase
VSFKANLIQVRFHHPDNQLVAELKRSFATVKHAKPPASRKDSSEWYVVAQGFKDAERP